MNNLTVLTQFKKTLISFLDELISQFPNEPDFVIVRIIVKDQIDINDVMKIMKVKLESCKDMITKRDEEFFLQNDSLFSDLLSKDKTNHFKRIWRSESLDDDDKTVIWQWVDSFVILSDKYVM